MTDTSSSLRILLTNDDGIDAPGTAVMREELTAVDNVTIVTPAENQSGVGRARNGYAVRRDHPWRYTLEGTPAGRVTHALRGLNADFSIIISDINDGPNADNCVVGRSGTVGAGVEATFLRTPAITIPSYHARDFFCHPLEEYDFSRPARTVRALTGRVFGTDVFDEVDLLNVNAPTDVPSPRMRVTHPFTDYDQQVDHDPDAGAFPGGDREHSLDDGEVYVRLQNISWPDFVGFESPFPLDDGHRDRYPVGNDRRAVVDGEMSVSPLAVHHGHATDPRLASIVKNLSEQME